MPETLSPIEKIRQAKEAKAEQARQEAEAAAKLEAEKAAAEAKEARRGELSFEREQVAANKAAAEQAAGTAKTEADEARTIQAEMGADIDADTAAAFEAVFAEESKANTDLERVNADLVRIDSEIQAIESSNVAGGSIESVSAEAATENSSSIEASSETPVETVGSEASAEVAVEKVAEAPIEKAPVVETAPAWGEPIDPEKIPGSKMLSQRGDDKLGAVDEVMVLDQPIDYKKYPGYDKLKLDLRGSVSVDKKEAMRFENTFSKLPNGELINMRREQKYADGVTETSERKLDDKGQVAQEQIALDGKVRGQRNIEYNDNGSIKSIEIVYTDDKGKETFRKKRYDTSEGTVDEDTDTSIPDGQPGRIRRKVYSPSDRPTYEKLKINSLELNGIRGYDGQSGSYNEKANSGSAFDDPHPITESDIQRYKKE